MDPKASSKSITLRRYPKRYYLTWNLEGIALMTDFACTMHYYCTRWPLVSNVLRIQALSKARQSDDWATTAPDYFRKNLFNLLNEFYLFLRQSFLLHLFIPSQQSLELDIGKVMVRGIKPPCRLMVPGREPINTFFRILSSWCIKYPSWL